MSFTSEWLLVAGILAFYVHDAARLAYFDEVVVAGGRQWRVAVEAAVEMRGRFLWIPSPLLPARTALRASWLAPADQGDTDTQESLATFARSLWPIRAGCVVAGMIVLIALPALLLWAAPPTWLLACLVAWLLVSLALVGTVVAQRRRLGLSGRQVASLATECLLCPPYTANLYRKLCDLRGFRGDPIAFAATLPATQRQALLAAIECRIALFGTSDGEVACKLQQARSRIRIALATPGIEP
ncbi:hypothetical protein [Pseudoxanthomonas sp.]|uniref:hypothetical protein n=1 Tax=Pseudoxanthomonas sp. TaxID=1871049 RepID=UPI002FE2CFC3